MGTAGLERWRAELFAVWQDAIDRAHDSVAAGVPVERPADNVLGHIAALLGDIVVRDCVLVSLLVRGSGLPARMIARLSDPEVKAEMRTMFEPSTSPPMDGNRATAADALLAHVAANAAPARLGDVYAVMAWAAWWSGFGARATVYVEMARECEHTPALAHLVADMSENMILPKSLHQAAAARCA
jgi:hypothetical protein